LIKGLESVPTKDYIDLDTVDKSDFLELTPIQLNKFINKEKTEELTRLKIKD